MRVGAKLLFLVLFLLTAFLNPALGETGKHASISVVDPVYDFGAVSQGATVEHVFSIENSGTDDLLIERAVPSCGCTVSKVTPKLISPGQSGKIEVAFDTTGFSGRKIKTVRVYTNDPKTSTVLLTLKGSISPDTSVEPRQIFLNDVVKDGQKMLHGQETLTVEVKEGSDISLGPVTTYSKYISIQEVNSSKKRKKVLVSVAPDAPIGEIRDKIMISLSGGKRKAINVPFFAVVSGPVKLEQSVVSFGVVSDKEKKRRSIKIHNRGNQAVSIKDVKTSSDALFASVVEVQAGKEFVLHIDLEPDKVSKDLKSTVTVSFNEPGVVAVPVSVVAILPPK